MMENLKSIFNTTTSAASIFMGGMLLLLYFVHIGYLPDPDVAALVYLLVAAALAGAYLVGFIAVANVLPALIWNAVILGKNEFANFQFESEKSNGLIFWFSLPFIPTLTAFTLVLLVKWEFSKGLAILLCGVAVSFSWLYYGLRRHGIKSWKAQGRYLSAWVGSWVTFVAPFLFILMFIRQGFATADTEVENIFAWVYLILLLFIAVFGNVVALQHNNRVMQGLNEKWRWVAWSAAVALILLIIVSFAAKAWWVVPQMVMRVYGLGGDMKVHLVFNKEGQDTLKVLKVPMDCAATSVCRIDTLLLRSRLGSHYVLFHGQVGQIVIPASAVLAIHDPTTAVTHNNQK